MTNKNPKPVPYDPELLPILAIVAPADAPTLSRETLPAVRAGMLTSWPSMDSMIAGRPITATEYLVPGPLGAPEIAVTLLSPLGHAERIASGAPLVPGLLNIHGGGMMVGHRLMDIPRLADLVIELGVVAASVEYRLAPEHPHPAPVEDCHAALVWMANSALELGIDPSRIVVMGGSAGGGLSAGVALLARDKKSATLAGQLLLCPMIDDRNVTVSSRQYPSGNTWTRQVNELGWSSLLGAAAGTEAASPYAAPTRAASLANLPPAFIEAGSAEIFRDENVEYASRIWAEGGVAELHIWSGGFHGFDIYAPDSALAHAAIAARMSWLRRILQLPAQNVPG